MLPHLKLLLPVIEPTVDMDEAGPPTTDRELTPAFLAQSLQPNIYAACIIVTVSATIAVGLRLLCRRLVGLVFLQSTCILCNTDPLQVQGVSVVGRLDHHCSIGEWEVPKKTS